MKILADLFIDELAGMYDAEQRIARSLPQLIAAVTCHKLQSTLENHLQETQDHVSKLEQIFEAIGLDSRSKICEAIHGMLKEADKLVADFKGSPAINAAIISVVQKLAHHEIASYGCLLEWAGLLEHESAAGVLKEILSEEKATDMALTGLARSGKNEEACDLAAGSPQPGN